MSLTLDPLYAANLASDVYGITSRPESLEEYLGIYGDDMVISKANLASGETGSKILRKPHLMGVLAVGKGDYKGQAFVVIKGTVNLYDALTDINTGLRASHTGFPVHHGFYNAFNSIRTDLDKFISGLEDVRVVHCVGHSLGGAIATLAADWIKATSSIPQVNLFTFGSPRVGLDMFSKYCTTRLNPENIYRVYHQTDPVPLMPTWPFYHVPMNDADCLIYSPVTARPWEYHLMKHYIRSVDNARTWSAIKTNRPKNYLDVTVEQWLMSDGVLSFSANTLELLNAAMIYVVKKVMNVIGIVMIGTAATHFTLLDRMAIFMARAANVSAELSVWVFRLVKKMASLAGLKVLDGTDLSVNFVRTVLLILHKKISESIQQIGHQLA